MREDFMAAGRPSIYTDELANEICDAIANSVRGLNYLCKKNEHWPVRSTILQWCRDRPRFSDMYTKARQDQADFMADEIIDVAYNKKKDHKIVKDTQGQEKTIVVNENVNRARLKFDSLKYLASVLKPRVYGPRIEKHHDDSTKDLMSRLIDKL